VEDRPIGGLGLHILKKMGLSSPTAAKAGRNVVRGGFSGGNSPMPSMLYMSCPINALLEGIYRDDVTIATLREIGRLRHRHV
jgi:hypothetical protein